MARAGKQEAESAYSRFFWIIAAAAVAGFGSTMFAAAAVYASQREMAVKVETITVQLGELRASMVDGTRNRYTTDDAARDRATLVALITSVGDRVTNHEARSNELSERLTRVESRLGTTSR